MDKIISKCFMLALLSIWTVESHAQWPLGKEMSQPSSKSPEAGMSSTVAGRHQIFVSPNIKGHTFMLDTDTGRIWIFKKDSASGDFSLQRVPVEQENAQGLESVKKSGSGTSSPKDK